MGKFNTKAKVVALTAVVASGAIAYAGQDAYKKSNEENENTAKLLIDKIDKDTVKVSVDNISQDIKAFQLSLNIDGNAEFANGDNDIIWKIDELNNSNSNVEKDYVVKNSNKEIDLFVSSDKNLDKKGRVLEICEINLNKSGNKSNTSYTIKPNKSESNVAYKSIDVANNEVEEANMLFEDKSLSLNTLPTIALKSKVGEELLPSIDIEHNIIKIKEGYEFDAKSFVEISDEEDKTIKPENIVVTDNSGKVITGIESTLSTGTHERIITATDNDGESTSLRVHVVVEPEVWTTKPILTGVPENDVIIYTGDIFDIYEPIKGTRIEARDAKGKAIDVRISGDFDLDKAGEYTLTYTAKDRFDNTEECTMKLIVKQDNKPTIIGAEDKVINKGDSFDPMEGITVNDDLDSEIAKKLVINGSVNTNIAKKYTLTYIVNDGRNETIKQRVITVNGAPDINGDLSYIIVKNGESISDEEILKGIQVNDDLDKDIKLELDKSNLDTSKDNIYKVKLTATDKNNLKTEVYRDIIVTSKAIVELPESQDGSSEEKAKKMQVVDQTIITSINKALSDLTKDNDVSVSKDNILNNIIYKIRVSSKKIAFRNSMSESFVEITVPKDIEEASGGIVIDQYQAIKVSSIAVTGNKSEISVGEELVLDTKVLPEDAENKKLIWDSSNNDIVSMIPSSDSQSATIKALKRGTSTIRVMATDGSEKFTEVVVKVGEQPNIDKEAPIFDYKGKTNIVIANGMQFETPIITATDNVDVGIKVNTTILNSDNKTIDKIDTSISGQYKIKYNASDKSGNKSELVINIKIKNPINGVEIGSGNAISENKALEIKIPTEISGLKDLIKEIENDKFNPKIIGKPKVDTNKNEATYKIKLYKKQGLLSKLFKSNKNEEIYYIKVTVKNTNEFKNILNSLPKEDIEIPPTGGGSENPLPPGGNEVEFNDIKDHWAEEQIKSFVKKGYLDGYGDGTFKPNKTITRAEFVKLINKVFNFTEVGQEGFTDVNKDEWFYNEICKGIKAGYIDGYEDNTFKPNKTITREEACKIVAKIMNLNGDGILNFTDSDEIASWARAYVDALSDNDIIQGYDDNTFKPKGETTRAEAVVTLSRIK